MQACILVTQNSWACPPEDLCYEFYKHAKHSTVAYDIVAPNVFETPEESKTISKDLLRCSR